MQARDVMTKAVVTVTPETPIGKIATLLLEKRISGVPVVDETGSVIGMVTEGDLVKSNAPDREKRREWWLTLLAEGEDLSKEFLATIRNNHRTARQIMSAPVVTVSEDTDIAEIGKLFTTLQIKRVPVTRDGRLTGIVARADLVRVVASQQSERHQEEGMFAWTLRFDPFKSAETPSKPVQTVAVPEEDVLSATNFRHLVDDAASQKARQVENQRHAAGGAAQGKDERAHRPPSHR